MKRRRKADEPPSPPRSLDNFVPKTVRIDIMIPGYQSGQIPNIQPHVCTKILPDIRLGTEFSIRPDIRHF